MRGGYRPGAGRRAWGKTFQFNIMVTQAEKEAIVAFLAEYRQSAPSLLEQWHRRGWKVSLDGVDLLISDVAGVLSPNRAIIQEVTAVKGLIVKHLKGEA